MRENRVRTKISFLIIFLFVVLSGCSNYTELNEIAIVLGIGIDYIPEKDVYEVTYQVVNPSENAARGTGSGGTPVINYKSRGKTISEAAGNSTNIFPRKNIYSHIQLVLIGEQLAKKESLNFIFDVFERDAGVRVNVPVLITRNADIKTTMDILSSIDKIPVRSLVGKVMNASDLLGEHGEIKIYDIIENLTNEGSEPTISGISIRGNSKTGASKKNIESMNKTFIFLNGIAVFNKGKLVGWIDGKKTKSLQIIKNKIRTSSLRIHCDQKRYNNLLVNHLKSKSKVDLQNSQAVITIQVNAFGNLTELLCNKDISKREVIKEYQRKGEQELEKEIKDGIIVAQKLESDVFGFGEILRNTHQKKWRKSKQQWNKLFSQAKVNVKVNLTIEGTGMRIKPYPY